MSYNLKKFSVKLNSLAKVLSEVLGLDVEIADNEYFRIAGTGRLKDKVGKYMGSEAHSYRVTISTGKSQIIENAKEDKICLSCPNRNICKEKSEISYPIIINGQTCGVIGLCCYTQTQKIRLIKHSENYLNFLETVTELIALDVNNDIEQESQALLTNMLYTVLDRVDYGIIVLNAKNKIVVHNKKLSDMLGESITNSSTTVELGSHNYGIAGSNESILKTKKNNYKILSKTYNSSIKEFSAIMFVYDCTKLKYNTNSTRVNTKGVNLLLGKSLPIINLRKRILDTSKTRNNILITGEPGTEINVVAHILHEESNELSKFCEFNCKSVNPNILDETIFGNGGIIQKSSKKWLFLRNIECLSSYSQAKLVDILSSRVFSKNRYAFSKNYPSRFIFSSNIDFQLLLQDNFICEELYYLITAQHIVVPPLRDRSEDIIKQFSFLLKRQLYYLPNQNIKLSDKAKKILMAYKWPGNILELNSVVSYLTKESLEDNIIHEINLPKNIINVYSNDKANTPSLAQSEKELIINGLNEYGSSIIAKEALAKNIGISVSTLYRKIKKYNI